MPYKKWSVTAVNGNTVSLESKYYANSDLGQTADITLPEGIEMYMLEAGCDADHIGQPITELKVGDRIYGFTDFENNPKMIFVERRMVESKMYYNTARMYDTVTMETTRVPENGYYVYTVAVEGKQITVKTKDKAIASQIDSYSNGVMGLKLNGNIVEAVYAPECVAGVGGMSNRFVTDIMSGIVRMVSRDNWASGGNYLLAPDVEIYDVTGNCKVPLGSKAELQPYDWILTAYSNEYNQITHIYIKQRYVEEAQLIFNIDRQYDATTLETTRLVDEEGYYVFELIAEGKQFTAKTKDKEIATFIDKNKRPVSAVISGGIIKSVYTPATCVKGGRVTMTGVTFQKMRPAGTYEYLAYSTLEPGVSAYPISKDCNIYNYCAVFEKYRGEKTTLREGDVLYNVISYEDGTIRKLLVTGGRQSDTPLYWHVNRQYNSGTMETARVPDADGWYVFQFAVDGQIKTMKTKDRLVATKADRRSGAFSVIADGDIMLDVITYPNTKEVKTIIPENGTVTAINGNKITIKGSTTNEAYKLTLAKKCKIYNISSNAKQFGAVDVLGVGDQITGFVDDNDNVCYIYIQSKYKPPVKFDLDGNAVNNDNLVFAEGTTNALCSVCNKNVTWTAVTTDADITEAGHYYLANNIEATDANGLRVITGGVVCLHLNGRNISNNNENSGQSAVTCGSGVLNILGKGTVHAKNLSKTGGAGAVLADCAGTTVNLCGGTYTGAGSTYSVLGSKGGAVLKVYKGVTVNSGNLGINGDATLEIYGGTFNSFFRAGTAGVGTLIVKDGTFTSPAEYLFAAEPGTVAITGGVFNQNPTAWVSKGCEVAKNGLVWYVGDAINDMPEIKPDTFDPATVVCEHCGVVPQGGWKAITLNSVEEITADGHYYLKTDLAKSSKAGIVLPAYNICLHLNGHSITGGGTNGRALAISDGQTVNIMGDGVITTTGTQGAIYCLDGTVNVYGGELNAPARERVFHINGDNAVVNVFNCTANGACNIISGTLKITGGTFTADPSAYVAEGYVATNNGNGTWTVAESSNEPGGNEPGGEEVPEINGNEVNNADLVFAEGTKDALCPVCNETVTWTELTAEGNITAAGHYYVTGSIEVTDKDGIKVDTNGVVCLHMMNGSQIINNATNTGNNGITCANGTLNIIGTGNVTSKTGSKTGGAGAVLATGANSTVNLYGGTYNNASASQSVLGTAAGATMRIYQGASASKGNLGISGESTLEIYGGTFACYFRAGSAGVGTVIIEGGSFTSGTAYIFNTVPGTATITGGIFNVDPTEYVPTGYTVTDNGDGTWTVAEVSDEPGGDQPGGNEPGDQPGGDQPGDEPAVFDPATSVCEHCGVAPQGGWTAITVNSAVEITADGHYYLDTEWSKSSKPGITLPAYNICLHLNGHSISGTATNGRTLSVTGGQTVNIMGEGTVTSAFTNTTAGGAIYVTNGTVNVYGGTYSAGSNAATVLTASGDTAVINVYGGTFTGILYVKEGTTTTYNIYGGTFTADPSAYVAEGYMATDNGDGTWTVAEEVFDPATSICKHCGVAPVGGWLPITTVDSAADITAAGHYYLDCDWVKSSKAGIALPAYNICLHLNGHSITGGGTNGRALAISNGQTVNIMGDGVITTTGTQGAIYCIDGTVNVYGGTYNAPEGTRVFHINGDNAEVNVYGGTYTGLAYVLNGTLNITGGTFSIDPEVNWNSAEDIRIYGGKFYFDPIVWVQEGYIVTDNGDGTWTVTQAPAAEG